MTSILRLAFRNTLRNGKRTVLTAATVTIGTAFVVFTLSFLSGVFGGMTASWTELNGPIRVVTTAYAEREELAPLHENIEDSAPVVAQVAALPGIASVAPIIRTGAIVTVGEELGDDATLLTGSTEQWYTAHVLPAAELDGSWLDYDATSEQVVVGSKIARDVGIRVGDSILLMGTTQYGSMAPISADVVGIVTGNASLDVQSFVTLETARWMVDLPDGALELLVYPEDGSEAGVAAAVTTVSAALGTDYTTDAWYDQGIWVQTKPILDVMNTAFSAIIVFVMALAVFNTMTMSVLERTGEIGVMRAMGQSRAGAVFSFLCESLMIGLAGGILGTLFGAIPALYFERNGVTFSQAALDEMDGGMPISSVLYADFSPDLVVTALAVGLLTAGLGAFFPSLRAARIPPSEAMRAQR